MHLSAPPRGVSALAAALAGVLAGPCAGTARADRIYVNIFDFDFSVNQPGEPVVDPVINVGDVVVWVVIDEFHTTHACAGQAEYWESPTLFLNDSWDHTFTTPGVYNYYCDPHGHDNGDGTASGMSGTITVLPAPGTPAAVLGAAALASRRRRPR